MSLRLHPKYGPNPTIPSCFFCGKEKNEVILLGASYKGEAPRHIGVMNHEPCDECKGYMAMGVILVSVKDGESDDNPYRTGNFVVIKPEAAKRIFPSIGDNRFAFVEDTVWKKIGLPVETKEPADAVPTKN